MSEGEPGTSDAGGGGSFWTSLPALLTASAVFLGAVVSAVVALRSDGSGNAKTDAAGTTTTSAEPVESRYFTATTRPAGRVYFEGGTMFVKAAQPSRPMLALAETEELLREVGLRANVEWVSGAKDFGVGFVCRYADAGNYYLISVLSGGRYHIVRYRKGRPVSLTGGIQTNTAVRDDLGDVGARCVGSDPVLLTLTAGGRDVATARDAAGIAEGNVGIRVGTSESAVTLAFRDFDLRSL